MLPFSSLLDFIYPSQSQNETKTQLAHDLSIFKSKIYDHSPFTSNEGGMGLEGAYFTHAALSKICPDIIFESGVWKGFTTYLFDQVPSVENIYSFDPAVAYQNFIQYKSPKAHYFDVDWASPMFSAFSGSLPLAFFDDHQDQLERLMITYCRGIKYALFDDNYFHGGGGHTGLADYMKQCPELLSILAKKIYIAPPLIFTGKTVEPIYSPADNILSQEIVTTVTNEKNYNWLTLVEMNKPLVSGLSQVPEQDYILKAYSRTLL